ncbi:MAG TPA: hypothetical protein EYM29_01570, partial [Rhodospirillales bacterium]|nr:hypothetical protein [Rhodospirillales bacterium]
MNEASNTTLVSGVRRLIAFSTSVIVPKAILDGLETPAYNFHPSPPTYPGSHATNFSFMTASNILARRRTSWRKRSI